MCNFPSPASHANTQSLHRPELSTLLHVSFRYACLCDMYTYLHLIYSPGLSTWLWLCVCLSGQHRPTAAKCSTANMCATHICAPVSGCSETAAVYRMVSHDPIHATVSAAGWINAGSNRSLSDGAFRFVRSASTGHISFMQNARSVFATVETSCSEQRKFAQCIDLFGTEAVECPKRGQVT